MDRSLVRGIVKLGFVACACGVLATGAIAQRTKSADEVSNLPDLNPGEGWVERGTMPPKGGQARAWSDPAAGCHLALMTLPATRSVGKAPMRASLEATLVASNLVISDEEGGLLQLSGADIHGLASLDLIEKPEPSASLLACYWSEREPAHCEALCRDSLQNREAQ